MSCTLYITKKRESKPLSILKFVISISTFCTLFFVPNAFTLRLSDMSKNIPTGNRGVPGSEAQKLRMILRSIIHGSKTDDSKKTCENGSTRKRLMLDLETKEENICNETVDENKWEKDQQKLGFPSATVVDEYHQKLRSRSNIERGILEKIHVELSNIEIEEDLIIMTCHPTPRKPVKRTNVVQTRLQVSILMFSCNHPWF